MAKTGNGGPVVRERRVLVAAWDDSEGKQRYASTVLVALVLVAIVAAFYLLSRSGSTIAAFPPVALGFLTSGR